MLIIIILIICYQDVLKKVVNQNKAYYDHLSKYGKSLNKEFISKPEYEEPIYKDRTFDPQTLNLVVAEHMFRSGNYTSGEVFCEEASIK